MTTELRRSVVRLILTALSKADRSVQWLAERSDIAEVALRAKLDLRADFTVTDLADIARALDVPVAELMPRMQADAGGTAD